MTRHGKNCTAGAVYTYHEKKKDTAASGYGTQSIRLGKDAIKDFDCCCLSLQPCQTPVVTPDGFLYEKQAILEYILHQKTDIAKKMKAYEKQKQAQKNDSQLESKSEEREKVEKFKTRENSIVSKPINPFTSGQNRVGEKIRMDSSSSSSAPSCSGPVASSSKSLPSFWIPSLTPEAKPTLLKKPDRYVCAVTKDVLGNSIPCAVLRPSGSVVTQECVEKLIKMDMTDPVSGDKLSDKDIIPLQRGGTGFAAAGVELKAKEARPVMQV
ncbi:nitric oxide synthase-interacting protein isoform X3 [Syngnathoides biaculeatus]|uniref:nitric oxide synthase-interacting protein isoform X3 n=1 Tax=Syngnathoides biaculeatus TaxID=300417 RepID=UPI002ADE7760|nr:nitric oxide synthase-interacting protein isoform X3 [Syngnathoides biaculeatus]